MSKIAYKGNPLGSGTITLETPNTNIDRTLTLPDETATLSTFANDGTGQLNTTGITEDSSGRVTMPYQPAFMAWGEISGSLKLGTGTMVNTGNHFNTSTGVFTVPVSGVYVFMVEYGTDDGESHWIGCFVNNVRQNGWTLSYGGGDTVDTMTQTRMYSLSANDTVHFERRGTTYVGYSNSPYIIGYLLG